VGELVPPPPTGDTPKSASPFGLEELLQALPSGIVVVDTSGRVVFANEASRLLGGLPQRGDLLLAGKGELATLERPFRSALEDGAELDEQREFAAPSGIEVRVRLLKVDLGGHVFGLLTVEDNTRVKQTERALATALGQAENQALRDPLTGLFNRRHLEAILPAELGRAQRFETAISVLAIDADHFKKLNDRFGHAAGDRALVQLARSMSRILRQGDTCARHGGEEFCAVLPRADATQALQAADRLLRIVRAWRCPTDPDLRLTVSIGVATARPPFGDDWETQGKALLARADEALYRAKAHGRDRTEVA
jgi:diguanylate cyclase (GGDEF)-like protein